jgi:ribosome biogenesis protein MAK21
MPREEGDEELLTDHGSLPSDVDGMSDDLTEPHITDDDGEGCSFVESSDAEDLLGLTEDGLIQYDGSDAESSNTSGEEWGGVGATKKRKRTTKAKDGRKKARVLPTFATYEDYAAMIEDAPEDNV